MSIDMGEPDYEVALCDAAERLSRAGPGAEMCVVEITVGTDNEAGSVGYHVVHGSEWPAFVRRVQAMAEGMGDLAVGPAHKEVAVEMLTILRNPVTSPSASRRYVFMAGRLAKPLHG